MSKKKIEVAIFYDFDGTLSPGNMQEYDFFNALGGSAKNFREEARAIFQGRTMPIRFLPI